MKTKKSIAITSDIDWANDEVINYLLSILDSYKIRATFFCTHELNISGIHKHELAIHPNFTKDKTDEETIGELMSLYPKAKGIRSHSLFIHSGLFKIYKEYGIEYDSNYLLPNQTIEPFFISGDVLELPIFFEDDNYFSKNTCFDLSRLNIDTQGIKIFNFHPVHIFLNTRNMPDYASAKKYLNEPRKLEKLRNTSKSGTKDLFIALLDYLKENKVKTLTLKDISNSHRGGFDGE